MFDTGVSQFSRNYNASSVDACEAARRTLLNQGYLTNFPRPDTIDATKDFQPDGDKHIQVEFHVVCVPGIETSDTSIVYANAVQNGFAIKKSDTSASVGLSIIGSVSLPIRSNSDQMVKVSSETIQSEKFYSRFFEYVDRNINSVVKKANPVPGAAISSSAIPAAPAAAPVAATPSAPAPLPAKPAKSAPTAAASAPAATAPTPLADDAKAPAPSQPAASVTAPNAP